MFRNAMLTVLLLACTMVPATASGEPSSVGLKRLLGAARGGGAVVIPTEWGGIWAVVDSTYDCAGVLQSVESNADTLCPGQPAMDTQAFPGQVDCTGSADGTSINVTCTGTAELFPDCNQNFYSNLHGTRTGESYFVVSTTQITYTGTAAGCDLVPGFCSQVNSHATRTGPAPPEYCQTPARATTWGTLKVRYR